MKRITRYVCLELLAIFAVALAAMTLVMLLVGLAKEALQQGLGPMAILRMMPYALPNALLFAVPGTLLLAACSVYGRMSASNEVLAIKSLGISPGVVIWPGLVLAFLFSLVTVWLNDVAVSWGRQGIHRVVIESVEQIIYGRLRTKKSYSTKQFSINVKRVEGERLIRPTLVMQGSGDEAPRTLTAQEARLRRDLKKNALVIELENGVVTIGDEASFTFRETIQQEISLSAVSRKGQIARSPSDCPMWRIPSEIRQQKSQIEQIERELAAAAGLELLMGDFTSLTANDWNARRGQLQLAQQRLSRLRTEPWRRWANGFSCLFFVMVGAPLAVRMRNDDLWTTFGLCFLPILVIYYPLLMLGVGQAKSGALHPAAVWIGNGVLLAVGYYLLRKVTR